jgi:hypothetical protein
MLKINIWATIHLLKFKLSPVTSISGPAGLMGVNKLFLQHGHFVLQNGTQIIFSNDKCVRG